MQTGFAHRLPRHVVAVEVGLDCPSRQGGEAAPACDELKNRHGELRRSPCRIDIGRLEDLADQIKAFVRDRVGDQRVLLEIAGREIRLASQWMMMDRSASTS